MTVENLTLGVAQLQDDNSTDVKFKICLADLLLITKENNVEGDFCQIFLRHRQNDDFSFIRRHCKYI